jgi:hypothetical protein
MGVKYLCLIALIIFAYPAASRAQTNPFVYLSSYGATSDANTVSGTVTFPSGSHTLTVSSAHFTSSDVGKAIVVTGAGASSAPLLTTISSYTSGTQVTTATPASTSLSGSTQKVIYGTDNTAKFQNWINACQSALATCVMNGGAYAITSSLNVTTGVKLVGSGTSQSYIIQLSPSANAISVNTDSAVDLSQFTVELFPGAVTPGENGVAVSITGPNYNYGSMIHQFYISGGNTGIYTTNASLLYVDQVNIGNVATGMNLQNSNQPLSGGYLISNTNIGCNVASAASTYTGILLQSGGNLQVSNSILHYCQYSAVVSSNINNLEIGDIFFDNVTMEQDATACLYVQRGNTGSGVQTLSVRGGDCGGGTPSGFWLGDDNNGWLEDVIISGVSFYPNSTGGAVYGIIVSGSAGSATAGGINISGNHFAAGGGSASTGILIKSGAIGASGSNTYRDLATNITNNSTAWTDHSF